jgi:hypothetical protein
LDFGLGYEGKKVRRKRFLFIFVIGSIINILFFFSLGDAFLDLDLA